MTTKDKSEFDIIVFATEVETQITNETAKVTVGVNALVEAGKSEADTRAGIEAVLKTFIPNADWTFSNVNRSTDTGHERVTLTASTRIKETENVNLENRARDAARVGIELRNLNIDTSIPAEDIRTAEKKLRAEIIKQAITELGDLNEIAGGGYRLGKVDFVDDEAPARSIRKQAGTYALEASASYGGGMALGNSQKLTLSAKVELRKS